MQNKFEVYLFSRFLGWGRVLWNLKLFMRGKIHIRWMWNENKTLFIVILTHFIGRRACVFIHSPIDQTRSFPSTSVTFRFRFVFFSQFQIWSRLEERKAGEKFQAFRLISNLLCTYLLFQETFEAAHKFICKCTQIEFHHHYPLLDEILSVNRFANWRISLAAKQRWSKYHCAMLKT